jgi:hypothetical protein
MSEEEVRPLESSRGPSRWSFNLSTLLLLVALLAFIFAWSAERNDRSKNTEPGPKYDVAGPLVVSYTLQTSPNSTAGQQHMEALGIDFKGSNVVVYTSNGGVVLPPHSLTECIWRPQ